MESIIDALGRWTQLVIGSGGYLGIIVLMALESACIPIPSELIMPFAGALTLATVTNPHPLNFHLVALAGAFGCALGSALAYVVGAYGGRDFVYKYGKYILLRRHDVEKSEAWFQRSGQTAVFIARLLPVVRTFISLPAGIARMSFVPFIALSFIGSVPWCYLLAWLGVLVQGNLTVLRKYFHGIDAVILGLLLIGAIIWIRHHLKPEAESTPETTPDTPSDDAK